jgi:hypothetical protein
MWNLKKVISPKWRVEQWSPEARRVEGRRIVIRREKLVSKYCVKVR